MPTIRLGRVRHLLKDGKAKIIKHHPFTIQLLYDSKTNTQPIEICEDVGYNYIGISVKSQSHEYVSAQYDTLQDEKACARMRTKNCISVTAQKCEAKNAGYCIRRRSSKSNKSSAKARPRPKYSGIAV